MARMLTRHALLACVLVGAPIALLEAASGCSSSHGAAAGTGGADASFGAGGSAPDCACGQTSVNGVPCASYIPCADGGTLPDCLCACTTRVTAGGCANVCSNALNGNGGAPPANFCEGLAPSAACATCLAETCPGTPTAAGTCAGQ
jgi:hypothetical protein